MYPANDARAEWPDDQAKTEATRMSNLKPRGLFAVLCLIRLFQFQPIAKAEEFDTTHKFVWLTLGAMYAQHNCGITFTPDSLVEYGDKIGADHYKLRLAIIAAVLANSNGSPYERADIIPAVTQNVLEFFRLTNGVAPAQVCKEVMPMLKTNGIIK